MTPVDARTWRHVFWHRRYNLTKAVMAMHRMGWRLWSTVLAVGPVAVMVVWRKRDDDRARAAQGGTDRG